MKKLLLGNAAVAQGAWEAGVHLVSSYPGTPSTEITECMATYPASDVFVEWAPNEKVAAEVAIGASIAGGRAMSCCKHVGLNVMADPIFTASYTGVSGGAVFCVADDPGMHSSQNEQDSRHYARGAKIPMLEPSDSEECKEYTRLAFDLSERFDTPFFLRLSTRVSHSQSLVEIGERAFYGCDDLTVIHLPATFRKFGAECFRACNSLQRVYCDGGMPRFEKSCLWTDNYISIFYPTNYVWPQEPVSQLISNFGGRLGITMGNYSDADLSELSEPGAAVEETKPAETKAPTEPEETEEPTEAATEAAAVVTEPVVTEPAIVLVIPTEAVTEPVETTEAITEPETQAPTEPETEATEPVLKEAVETLEGKSWIGLVMIGGVLTFLISGAMIFRSVSKKGGKYRR